MKTAVALEDLKINAMYKVEGKKEPFLKKILIKKDQFFLCVPIPKILQSTVFKEQMTK